MKTHEKRTFISSMNKSNPYRITNFTESLYNKILQTRESIKYSSPDPNKIHKTIYLPPVKHEENPLIDIKFTPNPFKKSSAVEHSPEILSNSKKTDSTQLISKSLDFQELSLKPKKPTIIKIATIKQHHSKILSKTLKSRRNSADYKTHTKTENLFKNTENPSKFPKKLKEIKSPWAFQIFKSFQF